MDTVEFALACYRSPLAYHDQLSLAAPLPKDMESLFWVANGSSEAIEIAVSKTGAKPQELRDAAKFCIQQLCLARGADHYRVLGLETGASLEQIKEHHRLLMRLFHPDRTPGRETWTEHYATRVNEAWTTLSRLHTHWQIPAVSDIPPTQLSIPIIPELADPHPKSISPHAHAHAYAHSTVPPFNRSKSSFGMVRWWSKFVLGGLISVLLLIILDEIDWVKYPAAAPPANSSKPTLTNTTVANRSATQSPLPTAEPTTTVADRSAIPSFLALPDWQAPTRQELENRQQVTRIEKTQPYLQQQHNDREQIAAQEALLKQLWKQRPQTEVKIEMARIQHADIGWLIAEQQRLEQMKAEQVQTERLRLIKTRIERLTLEQQRLQELQNKPITIAPPPHDPPPMRKRREITHMDSVQSERQPPTEQQNRTEPVYPPHPTTRTVSATTATDKNQITQLELENLLTRYTYTYERGNADDLMKLFTLDAKGKDGSSRTIIYQDYATLFSAHPIRQLRLHNVSWAYQGESASGTVRYELQLKKNNSSESSQVEGGIHFKIRKQNRRVLIEAIDYDWNPIENR